MNTLEITCWLEIVKEFDNQHVELHIINFDGERINYELRKESRSSNYNLNIENVSPHEFRVMLLQNLNDFFNW